VKKGSKGNEGEEKLLARFACTFFAITGGDKLRKPGKTHKI